MAVKRCSHGQQTNFFVVISVFFSCRDTKLGKTLVHFLSAYAFKFSLVMAGHILRYSAFVFILVMSDSIFNEPTNSIFNDSFNIQ